MTSSAIPAQMPCDIGDVTPAWLTGKLRADGSLSDTLTVTEARAERIAEDTGFSALLYRVHLSGHGGVPATVIAKLPAESEARSAMELLGGYRKELDFYRHIAPHAPISTPHCYAAEMSDNGFVLLLEDLRDWDNADHLAGLSLPQARLCIGQLAGLHTWSVTSADDAALRAYPALDNTTTRELFLPVFALGWQVCLERTTRPVPPAVASFAERFAELAPQALEALSEQNMLLHGDIRADNMFFRGDELKIVDFQMAVRGAGAADVAYLVSQGLPTDVRRGHDRELVTDYVARMNAHGITDYTDEQAWRHYRLAVALLMYLPTVILVTWDSLPPRSQRLCLTLVDRAVAAIDDLAAVEVFA